MFFKLLKWLKEISLFTASYSNNVFPEPLSKEEEDIYIVRASNGDKEARNKFTLVNRLFLVCDNAFTS